MTLTSKLLLISRGREDSRAHRLAVAIVEYAWDRGAEVRVRCEPERWASAWTTSAAGETLPEVTAEDLAWADVTIVLAAGSQARAFGDTGGHDRLTGPQLVS